MITPVVRPLRGEFAEWMAAAVRRGAERARPDADVVDLAAVEADERLMEDLRAGCIPPSADHVAAMLMAWRSAVYADPTPTLDVPTIPGVPT